MPQASATQFFWRESPCVLVHSDGCGHMQHCLRAKLADKWLCAVANRSVLSYSIVFAKPWLGHIIDLQMTKKGLITSIIVANHSAIDRAIAVDDDYSYYQTYMLPHKPPTYPVYRQLIVYVYRTSRILMRAHTKFFNLCSIYYAL